MSVWVVVLTVAAGNALVGCQVKVWGSCRTWDTSLATFLVVGLAGGAIYWRMSDIFGLIVTIHITFEEPIINKVVLIRWGDKLCSDTMSCSIVKILTFPAFVPFLLTKLSGLVEEGTLRTGNLSHTHLHDMVEVVTCWTVCTDNRTCVICSVVELAWCTKQATSETSFVLDAVVLVGTAEEICWLAFI